jgi:hypothetical protein
MKLTQTKSDILEPKPIELGFLMDDYAAVPLAGSTTKLVIIHNGKILKTCRNRQSAITFIKKHSKTK